MASNTNRKRSKAHQTTLEDAMKKYNDSQRYQKDNWYEKWKRDNALYDSERWLVQYHGVTDTFVPITFSTVETIETALNNANLRFDYKSSDPMRQASTAPLNALIDEWWDDDQWDLAFEEDWREMLVTGMAGNMLSWEGDRPHLEHYAMVDMVVDPAVKHPRQLQQPGSYAGRRYLVRKGQLDNYEVIDTDENSDTYGEMVKRFKLPKNSGSAVSSVDEADDKTMKELFTGSTLASAKDDQDEVIEIWDVDRVITILNRQDVIEDIENPYKSRHRTVLRRQYEDEGLEDAKQKADDEAEGLVPFFFFRNYRRTSLFYAKSEIDSIAKPQEELNDLRNMKSDSIIKVLSRQRWLDPKYADFLPFVSDEPDVTNLLPADAMGFYEQPQVDFSAFRSEDTLKSEIRETTAIDQIMHAQAAPGDQTATEINAQMGQSSERIESKARILEKDGLYWMGHILFRMFQLFVDEPLAVEVSGQDAENLKTTVTMPDGTERQLPPGTVLLDPRDYRGNWRPKITLEIDAKTKKLEEQKGARETFQIMIQDPTNNLPEAKKIMYPKFTDLTKDEIERITTADPSAAMPGMPPGAAPVPGAPVDPAMAAGPQMPVGGPETAPGAPPSADVDTNALTQQLTPEELAQLQEAIAAEGQPA